MVEHSPRFQGKQLSVELVEKRPSVTSYNLKEGGRTSYPTSLRDPGILELDGQAIALLPHPVCGTAFSCPGCGRACYRLHRRETGEWLCRTCPPALDYACRRLHRAAPGWARAAALRRRLGADPEIGSPLPKCRAHAHRKIALAIELRRLEEGLGAHGAAIAQVLEKRNARRYRRRYRRRDLGGEG
jgi:hypothetical protein